MEVVASLSQGRTAAAQCGLFTYKSVPVIFEPPCTLSALDTVGCSFKTYINSHIGEGNPMLLEWELPVRRENG